MTSALKSYSQRFDACLATCRVFDNSQGSIRSAMEWIAGQDPALLLARGVDNVSYLAKFTNKDLAGKPIPIHGGGECSFIIRCYLGRNHHPAVEFDSFSMKFRNLRRSINGIYSLRFDRHYGQAKGSTEWDDDFGDSFSHPIQHIHVNWVVPHTHEFQPDPDLRIPMGKVDPILFLKAIDHWYSQRACP